MHKEFSPFFLFTQYKDSCYFAEYLHTASWHEAESLCNNKHGGHLWAVNSHEEWDAVFTKDIKYHPYYAHDGSRNHLHFDPVTSTHFYVGKYANSRKVRTLKESSMLLVLYDYTIHL